MKRLLLPLSLLSFACAAETGQEEATTTSAGSGGATTVFDLQAHIFCPTGTFCGYATQADLEANYFRAVAEMNLEYAVAGISYRALPPILTQDNRFSTMTGPEEAFAGNGELNSTLEAVLIATQAATHPNRITMFLAPELERCWNGIPCPGADDGFDGDDVIFCRPPSMTNPEGTGTTYAHEMGHYWCLRHTFTGADAIGPVPVDHDGDDDVCDSLSNVQDTPSDPWGQEDSDLDGDGDPIAWHEWCVATQQSNVDASSPHDSYCTVECFQQVSGNAVTTGYSPLTENAMSYYGGDCRGPYVVGGVRHEAFTAGQVDQIEECRNLVLMRALLVDVCASHGGDSDNDGTCDDDDECPNTANTPDAGDTDGDGFFDPCDACPTDSDSSNTNTDGDAWCNQDDRCPTVASASNSDTDGDGIGNACDTCPNHPDPTNLDTDGDGAGDACDTDDDNDGCSDATDQHPKEDSVVVGTEINVNCSPSSSPRYGSEAVDSDGDGLANCRDTDDDNDGVLDGSDACPITAGSMCFWNGPSCPLAPIFFTCRGGGCNQYLLRIVEAVNPDPTVSIDLRITEAVRDTIVVEAMTGRSLTDTSLALRAQLPLAGGRYPRGLMKVTVVDARSGRQVHDLATYVPWASTYRGLSSASRLSLALPRGTGALGITAIR